MLIEGRSRDPAKTKGQSMQVKCTNASCCQSERFCLHSEQVNCRRTPFSLQPLLSCRELQAKRSQRTEETMHPTAHLTVYPGVRYDVEGPRKIELEIQSQKQVFWWEASSVRSRMHLCLPARKQKNRDELQFRDPHGW